MKSWNDLINKSGSEKSCLFTQVNGMILFQIPKHGMTIKWDGQVIIK